MASSMDKLAKELKKQMTASDERKPRPYDTQAEVLRVENGVAWVHIPGGVDETPVRLTINAKKGDNVNLHVANGTAWITGNSTNPPTDDSTANYAVDISNEVKKDVIVLNTVVAENIEAANARFTNVEADTAKIHDLTADNLHATVGYIDDLTADSITANDISAASGYIKDLEAENITAQDITADHATVGSLDANYAQIDMANVNNAWIENGYIKKAEVFDENVFDLSGNRATLSRIDASKINVANLRADNLVVRRINGQPVVGGYTLIDSNSPGYSSKNPQALGWYEFVNAQWVLSTDTTVDLTKAYYQEGNEVSLYDQQYIDSLENDLQQQIDGAVETFTGSVVPTLVNYPYTDWYDTSVTPIHDERAKHIGDIYYVVNSAADENGYCYRFTYDNTTHAYSWVLIKDSDVTKALSDISELQTFESETTSWIEETDEGLETIRTNHTTLAGVVDKTVKESIQLWYTKANTTAPNKPTAEVISTSTAGNAWRKVVPAWNASYPNYYYCWQYKFVDGTFGWSDVVRDIAMGETQGTARDAKNTADAALPASTFTSFESTTFKNVKDTVDEQSTKFTNMTTRLGLNADGSGANTDIVAKESALEQTVEGVSSRVSKTETKLAGMYATSSTAAGTKAKVATITPAVTGWELYAGATVTVKFSTANTHATPTLNVNSTGAKNIKGYKGAALTEAEYKWAVNDAITFVYDGTNWLMQNSSTSATRLSTAESNITQTATSIESVVANNETYTAPDGTTKTNSIKSAIKQNADNIELKVSKDGVIASINASVEESGGSALKISADKVNIEGAAIFTGSGRLSTTSLNNAYDVKGAAQNAVDGIEVGGRNLLVGTGTSISKATTATSSYVTQILYDTPNLAMLSALGFAVNDEVTLSFDWKITSATTYGNARIEWYGKTSSAENSYIAPLINPFATFSASNTSGHVTKTVKLTSATVQAKRLVLRIDNSNLTLTISNLKLEKGNKATDWSPAPEDVQAEIDAKKSVWTLMTSGTGSTYANILNWTMEGRENTSWGINTTATPIDKIKVGDTVRVAYKVTDMGTADNRPYVYVIGEFERSSGSTVYLTMHGLDTTIIDGGNIITNSIGANQIQANSINTSKLAVGDWTNLVTANELYPDSLPASSVSISNGYLIKTTATQQYILLTKINPRTPNNFKKGDELYVEFYAKAASATTAVFSIYGYDSSNTYLDGNSALINGSTSTTTFNIPTTETKFTGTITLTRPAWDTAAYYEIDLNNNASTKVQIYMRKVVVRKKSNGELIVDGSITADHLAANSIVIGKMKQDTKDQILNSNVHVGGTNLLGRTSNPVSYTINNSNANATFGDIGGYNSPASEFSLESYDGASNALVITSTATGNRGVGWYTLPNTIKAGETYTFSCLVKTSVAATVHTHTAWRNGSAIAAYTGWTSAGSLALEANAWTDYSYTFTPSTSAQLNWEFMVALCFTGQTTGVTCHITHAKLEKGNKSTDWSPSPADAVNENLLSGSQKMDGWLTSSNASVSTSDEFGVVTLTGSTSNWSASVSSFPTIRTSILDGTPLWLSFEYKASVSSNIYICLSATSNGVGGQASPRTKYTSNLSHTHSAATTWQRSVVKMPTSLSALSNGSGDTNSLFVQFYNRTDNSTVQVRKVKLERGAYASEWTPSPEDFKTYVTRIDDNGIRIHPASTENNSVVINASGMEVFKGGTTSAYSVAKYGDTARIGKESGSHLTLAPDSMSMSDGVKDVFNVLQKTMYIRWNRNYKGRQFANSTDRYVDSWETNTTISTWDSITVNYKLNNTSRTKKITSISNGVLANDEIYVHFNYSGTIITLTYGRGSSAASSDIIKLGSAVVYYVTDEKLSQLHTGTYPNTTVSGALRIGNGTSDSNRRNLMLVDWSGTGKFKGDILAFCGADSSGGMSLTKAEENIDAFKYEDANGHVYIDAYRVGRIVSLLCNVRKTPSIAPGANLYLLNLTNAHLPKPLGTNTSGTGIYSNNMIIGNIYYNKTVTPNRYEFVCRNGGSTAVSTGGVGFSITYICQMDEVSGEIKYMDD